MSRTAELVIFLHEFVEHFHIKQDHLIILIVILIKKNIDKCSFSVVALVRLNKEYNKS